MIYNALIWQWAPGSANGGTIDGKACPGWLSINNTGRIDEVHLGDTVDLSTLEGISAEECLDAMGKLVIPGLHDGHIHVEMVGESSYFVNLKDCDSIAALQSKLSSHAEKNVDLPWIIGVNWDQTKLGRYPNRQDLDVVCSDRPIFLWRACWHIGVANSNALEKAGITLDQSHFEISGGVIEIFEDKPSGIVKERACELITKAMGEKSFEQKMRFIKDGLRVCSMFGLTSVQSNDEKATRVYADLMRSNKLPLRVFLTPMHHEITSNEDLTSLPWLRRTILSETGSDVSGQDSRLSVQRVKIFGDGALGSETAALRGDDGSVTGVLIHDNKKLSSMIRESREKGLRLEIHAIGDAAAEQVLTTLESLDVRPEERPLLTHCQILGEDLLMKIKSLNVIANVQPSFVPTDMEWIESRISAEKQLYSYAWKTMLSKGICVAGGSDAPIETSSPFVGMYDAIHRCSRSNASQIYRCEEKLSFPEALWIYTVNPAYSTYCENSLGRVDKGFAADLVIIDPDVIESPHVLGIVVPEIVIIGGAITYVHVEESGRDESAGDIFCGELEGPYIPGKNGGYFYLPQKTSSLFADTDNTGIKSTGYASYSCRCCRLWR